MKKILVCLSLSLLLTTTIPTGTSDETLSTASDGDHDLIELKAPAPEWWNAEVEAKALEAAERGMLYNPLTEEFVPPQEAAPVDLPYGSPDYLFIRPGVLGISGGAICTYNFIYSARTQIGTAGHCVLSVGQTVAILALPAPNVPLITALGRVAAFRDGGVGDDWALIDIFSQWQPWVDPNMAYLGGPSCAAWSGGGGIVKSVGHGIQTGLISAFPRSSTAGSSNGASFQGFGLVSGGDSGSPAIQVSASTGCSGGAAAGIVTHCLGIIAVCIPIYIATDVRKVPATVTVGFDPL